MPITQFHRSNHVLHIKDAKLFDWLACIEEHIVSYENFFQVSGMSDSLITGHHCAYNFENLWQKPAHDGLEPIGTIEFRQHAGTLNSKAICVWVMLTTQIVKFCTDVSAPDFLRLLISSVSPRMTLPNLLALVCKDRETKQYYTDMISDSIDDIGKFSRSKKASQQPKSLWSGVFQKASLVQLEHVNGTIVAKDSCMKARFAQISKYKREGKYGTLPSFVMPSRVADDLILSFEKRCRKSLELCLAEDREESETHELAAALQFVASVYGADLTEERYLAKLAQY
ncbi:hypothetical protein LTR78_009689 [Recurvomyces mirabilis]|uniref:Uncharacterized protein n=1 Tax=Recurvomyces mirabilis TaxID=574656 RepID=A0AAE0WII6_9PEZI|nr:hypothetical protein LTR78_009689 [Recurvomyces mirabilis]KAK5150269.1 hypothetical protein LTS14_010245 [Recurvomyces mirabilis]